MQEYVEAKIQDLKRRRRERYLIICLVVVISILIYIGIQAFDLGQGLPFSSSILVFALININVILLLLLLFLTVRNLVKLLFERRKNIMGAKLRTKLVLAFMTLSLLPTMILFFVSVQFISTSVEHWFNLQIERSLKNSLEVGQDYYKGIADEIISFGNNLSRLITYEGFMLLSRKDELERFIREKQKEFRLASLGVVSDKLAPRAISQDHRIDLSTFKGPGADILRKCFEKGTDSQQIQSFPHGDFVTGIAPIFSRTKSKAVVGLIILSKFVPGSFVNRLKAISRGLQEYQQLKMLKKPIKISHMVTLSIVTLLIIFSSVWFGFYLSREITVPIKELAEGTKRIAAGDYDFSIDLEGKDEIGELVNSFNRMTLDLKTGKEKLEETNRELMTSNLELEQRRLYMEIVLANVAAGVVSADAQGKILTINKSAERMLGIDAEMTIGKNFRDVLSPEYIQIIDDFLDDEGLFRKGFLNKQIKLSVRDKRLTLLVSLNVLRDDRKNYLGLVAVFEDLSEIEKAQRMAAWREVARRIAHEVKNPLTPIQLSAQRLKRKYGEKLGQDDGKVFEECTDMIIDQVEGLKRLVNEFSSYARMPASNPRPDNIRQIIEESVSLYKETQKDVEVVFRDSMEVPDFRVDRAQIKRVMINLLDNAIDAIDGNGVISIDLSFHPEEQTVSIEVADNGNG
ncbi:MAG: HAMP domain-containing protein, partial [Desulfobacteraceae bacterium]|nr:HAMP domain-containing protein [Desulfobacteraceae bacterium]